MLRKKSLVMTALTGLIVFQATAAYAMRCGTHIISDGERHGHGKYELLKKCGQPKTRDGNIWIYEKYGKTYFVTFDSAGRRVNSIEQ